VNHLSSKRCNVFSYDIKVFNTNRTKYFYPDVCITKEGITEQNQYIQYERELIIEVILPATHITDTIVFERCRERVERHVIPAQRRCTAHAAIRAYLTVKMRFINNSFKTSLNPNFRKLFSVNGVACKWPEVKEWSFNKQVAYLSPHTD
jgi:hypothetical protein